MSSGRRQPAWAPRRVGWGQLLLLGLVAEAVAFVLVVRWVGFGGALLIGLATSLVGAAMTRRLGRSAASHLRAATRGGPAVFVGAGLTDGLLQGVAALLLILPGFLSDAAGLLLLIPAVRTAIRARTTGGRRPQGGGRGDGVIDLSPRIGGASRRRALRDAAARLVRPWRACYPPAPMGSARPARGRKGAA